MKDINTLLNFSWWNYLNIKKERKLQYISPIPSDKPGWYLWLDENMGVFELILSEWQLEENKEKSTFTVKYYPDPEEELFTTFSFAEQIVRLSDFFNNSPLKTDQKEKKCACSLLDIKCTRQLRKKGFPKIHARKKIHPTLFTIGEIKFTLVSLKIFKSSFISQNKIIQYAAKEINIPQEKGTLLQLLKPGDIDRNIPAWEIGWQLYDVLVNEVFNQMKIYPKYYKRVTNPGVIYYQGEGGNIWSKNSNSVTRITHSHYY